MSIIHRIFKIETNFRPRGGKYLIKIIFGIKIQIPIFKLSNVSNVNKFRGFLMVVSTFAFQFWDQNRDLHIWISKCAKCQYVSTIFNIVTIFRLRGSKYLMRIILGSKIEIHVFALSNMPNVNQFIGFLVWGRIKA